MYIYMRVSVCIYIYLSICIYIYIDIYIYIYIHGIHIHTSSSPCPHHRHSASSPASGDARAGERIYVPKYTYIEYINTHRPVRVRTTAIRPPRQRPVWANPLNGSAGRAVSWDDVFAR